MHPPHIRAEALALVQAGLNDCEISRRLGIPRRTILDWRRPTYVPRVGSPWNGDVCPRCWRPAKGIRFTPEDYSELLGLYLGDGCISAGARTMRLRITLDLKYPQIISDAQDLLARSLPHNRVDVVYKGTTGNCVNVSVYSQHLPCLLPQHGPGKKHERRIGLETWQWRLVETAPCALLRGLIRSDGCVFVNRTDIHRPRPYEYLSSAFSNMSKDIVDIFLRTCDLVGIEYRVTRRADTRLWNVRINRRGSVQMLLDTVGMKR